MSTKTLDAPESITEELSKAPPIQVEAFIPGSLAEMRIGEVNILGPFAVPGLAPRNVRVYLPLGFSPDRQSFGLYMFDGQNLFGDAPSFAGGWRLHEAIERLARRGRPAPVAVGIDHGGLTRIHELSPFEVLSEPGQSPLLLDWITQSLIPALEEELNLIPGPLGAVIGGSSMGGLCALWSHFHYPRAFGGALAKSPSFWIADQAIFADIEAQPLPPVSRIYLDAGGREDKGRHLPLVAAMASELAERGYDSDRLMFRPDARGTHSEASWRRRLPKALQFFYRR